MSESSTTNDADPFALLGLERRFDVDPLALTRAWLTKAARLHPDRNAGRDESAGEVARLNEAKRTLEDPERRAGALLVLLGGKAKEDDKSLPDGFLMEIMEIRQGAEQAASSRDRAGVERFRTWASQQRDVLLGEVGRLFQTGGATPEPGILVQIRLQLNALRYIERMLEQVVID